MKKTLRCFLFAAATMALLAGCKPETMEKHYDEADLVGKWVLLYESEYWRFDSGHYGETWDESEDVHEGEGTKFSWSVSGETLAVELTGEMGQVVPYDYTIVELTEERLVLRDAFETEKKYLRQ